MIFTIYTYWRKLSYLKRPLLSGTIPLYCKGNTEFLEAGLPVNERRSFNYFIQETASFFFLFLLDPSMAFCIIYQEHFIHETPISVTVWPSPQNGIMNVKHGLFLHGHKTITFQTYASYAVAELSPLPCLPL